MTEQPTIVTNWDSMPPEVYAEGEWYSTRVLADQHRKANQKVDDLTTEIDELLLHKQIYENAACEKFRELTTKLEKYEEIIFLVRDKPLSHKWEIQKSIARLQLPSKSGTVDKYQHET